MLLGFVHHQRISLMKRSLKIRERPLHVNAISLEEPLELIDGEVLDRFNSKGARLLTGVVPSHTVCDKQ